jgi:hypothetical protein
VQLEWLFRESTDDFGKLRMHYLYDPFTSMCYATIPEPRNGSILYVTDIRVSGFDRSYLTLEGAKAHCEYAAWEYDVEQVERLAEKLEVRSEIKDRERVE